jgi:hypothetical protein
LDIGLVENLTVDEPYDRNLSDFRDLQPPVNRHLLPLLANNPKEHVDA